MRLGLTYDLRDDYLALGYSEEETAEFDSLTTIDALAGALAGQGHQVDRIGRAQALVERLAQGDRWDLVFNIVEGLVGYGREALVPALLEAYGIPYTFSDPLTSALTLHKGLAKRVVRDAGVPTPAFAVIETAEEAKAVDLAPPLFVKPVAEGTGKGVTAASKITSPAQLEPACAELLARFSQPVLVESFLAGREFTVGVLGTGPTARTIKVVEVRLGAQADREVYSWANKEHWRERVTYHPVDDPEALEAGRVALAAYRALGCRDAGRVDVRSDSSGRPHFLEVNPLAGLHPHNSDLVFVARFAGMDYQQLIGAIVAEARARQGLT